MIPVVQQRAPKGFNDKVLRPGRRWLKKKGLPLSGPVPEETTLKPYWRWCLNALHKKYGGVCAYVSIYIEKVTGSRTVDHFIAKSSAIELAYRWNNYRLACGKVNGKKGIFHDVLDPFELKANTFHLNLFTGKIDPNPALAPEMKAKVQTTITRLGLDEEDCRSVRRDYFTDYIRGEISEDYLKRRAPFVWHEVCRQKMLR